MRFWAACGMCIAVSGTALPARASSAPAVLPATRLAFDLDSPRTGTADEEQRARGQELRDWIKAYRKFRNWDDTWRNHVYPYGKRRRAPGPPAWLAAACAEVNHVDLPLSDDRFAERHFVSRRQSVARLDALQTGCLLLEEWRDDYATAQIRREIRLTRAARDRAQPHTVIWELINFDMMYSAPSAGSPVRAPFGVHVGFPVGSRIRLFAAPGAILVCTQGFSNCRIAYDYGVGVRLFDFRMPGIDQPASVHLNLAKAWILGGSGSGPRSGVDIAGFSIAFKRR